MTETIYKWLNADGTPCNGGSGRWHLPVQNPDGTWKPGRWMPRIAKINPCRHGYHGCRAQDLIWWIGPTLWELEYDGEYIEHTDSGGRNSKVIGHRARLLRPIETWNARTARLCAADFAEHVLPVWTAQYPNDDRPARAIEVARRFAMGTATEEDMAAAWDAAGDAAWDAARAAARAAERQWQSERLQRYIAGTLPEASE